ncbi:MAG TPA: deoxyribodipyrimidine photo-lyase [Actinomycetota bacterium]
MRILVLFTRDLRVHDHPALSAACRAGNEVEPLFVLDPRMLRVSANRSRFLVDALRDLDASLARRGARLVIRSGDPGRVAVDEALRHGCDAIHLTADVTGPARRRLASLRRGPVPVRSFPGHGVVEPGAVAPAGRPAYRVFTPYARAWFATDRRPVLRAPASVVPIPEVDHGIHPSADELPPGAPHLPAGGESEGRARLTRFLRRGPHRYGADRDDLAADATSRLSAFLRFGCLSATQVAERAETHPESRAFLRQLAWRDFFLQLVAADPALTHEDLRPERASAWRRDRVAFDAWREGCTGVRIVDAGMRQLLAEGWMPNRARLITASFLTRTMAVDWRWGAAHFAEHLVDGDPASNAGNWQWVAGTGASPRRGIAMNPDRQAARFDPDGAYRARWLDRER